MSYRANSRAIRALADGNEPFWAVVAAEPDFDGAEFAAFVVHHKLIDWVGVALEDDRAPRLFPRAFLAEIASHRAMCGRRRRLFARTSGEVQKQLAGDGIPCLFLKGLHFGQRFYPDVARRHLADVDVLVRARDFEPALGVLRRASFQTQTDLDSGKPLAERLRLIRNPVPGRAPHAVTVRRGDAKLDLHWCLRSRSMLRLEEAEIWAARQEFRLGDTSFETLSDEHSLVFLLVSICADVKRGACRAKHLLDLYLFLRALECELDWEAFFARRAGEGLRDLCLNVLALFLVVWECAEEFQGLARVLDRHRGRVALRVPADAFGLMERPPRSRENHAWRRRVYPRSRWHALGSSLILDLPYTVSRLLPSRRFQVRFARPEI